MKALRFSLLLMLVMTAFTALGDDPPTAVLAADRAVKLNTNYPDLLTVTIKTGDKPIADGTDVVFEVVGGDARVFKGNDIKNVAGTATTKTKDGVAKASLLMGKDAKVFVVATTSDKSTRSNLLSLDADEIPAGDVLTCSKGETADNQRTTDCRDDTALSFYTGYVINTFAAPQLSGTNNDATSQDIIAGFDFAHRIRRRHDTDRWGGDIWVYGETLHGIRSTDDCSGSNSTDASKQKCATFSPTTGEQSVAGIIKGASTLEAYAGLRWEPPIHWLEETGSRAYVKGQVGFISLLGRGTDLIDNHHAGIGVTKVHGRFTDSYFEVGYGRNDLFKDANNGRWKFDGLIEMNMKYPNEAMIRPFIQMTVDSDFGRGGDSVQSFIGLDFDLSLLQIFGK